ncbi:laminin subunit beta-2-like, partial [Phyllostomus discolor]|uniref:Laminin subunit beta-2-like n=2 Tax=Phyllostomus discolor TaxID=89673 RepID=A0A7E6E8W4_9CHIR
VQAPRTVAQEVPGKLTPSGCSSGSCHPPTGNLLVGRAQNLRASSTCGLHSPEPYCTVRHLQDAENCFFCDSRDRGGHGIENVISRSGPAVNKTWWQAESGVENVTIQLDLEGVFYFTHLVMAFKTFRPAALSLERSVDHGRSWHVYRYFAHNCSHLFPGIPPAPGRRVGDLVCDQRYSDIEPPTEGKVRPRGRGFGPWSEARGSGWLLPQVIFQVLDPAIQVENPNDPKIQELLRVTNLRVNFSRLHTLGDRPLGGLKGHPFYYYALYELVASGSCLCHGHSSECRPAPGAPAGVEGMVHGHCVCRHHTAGAHCERCQDLHRDRPWHPAEPGHPHACQECQCHGHARSCHFDMALYLASGNVSGGVCDTCQHNTAGRRCELCRPFFHRDPQEDPRSPRSCKPCDCDPVGALDGGLCDAHTDETRGLLSGLCRCKVNVWGRRCDACRPGHYGLSLPHSEGCQPCRCDPRGRVPGTPACDPSSGACHCKRFVSGRDCSRCLPEFWGLSSDSLGCRPCDCDFGGAYSNRCSTAEGACLCRPHLRGRRCHELQSGYFCAALDQASAEAELGQSLQPADPRLPGTPWPAPSHCIQAPGSSPRWLRPRLQRQRDPRCALHPARRARYSHQPPTAPEEPASLHPGAGSTPWTGLDFARVADGAGLSLLAPTVPRALEYDIVLRYETQAPEDWQALVSVRAQSPPSSTRCAHLLPSEHLFQATLTHAHRAVVLSRPFCFEPGTRYSMTLRLWRTKAARRLEGGTVFLDSVALLPRVKELPGLRPVDPGAAGRLQELRKAGCVEAVRTGLPGAEPEACARLVCSISALLHGGGLPCECHPQGSLSTECALLGGQCPCRPNIGGRTCDHCVPGTYGFGPTGCSECGCHSKGATGAICNPVSGQCTCRVGLAGRRCDRCLPDRWGFPRCQPCVCNGHAELCHPLTGVCQACQGATTGRHCERCLDGYYGDPTLGSGQQCRPCLCPGPPGSGLYHGTSCHVDNASGRVLCLCAPGYAGPRCDRCSSGYFGRPWPEGDPRRSPCRPCQCNNNIDPRDPAACDPHSGRCQRCLHHSHGPGCAHCRPGFHGSALRPGGCRRCSCDPRGTVPSRCPPGAEACFCNQLSGQCPCRPHTLGRDCSRCAPLFWNLGGPRGCEPCSCHVHHSLHPACHPVTGQCPCRAGFGGRTCSRCQDGYWGDPAQECRACACDPQGSVSPSCEPYTGACLCREGISGPRCQACARGSRGGFPHCMTCPACFTSWDQRLALLRLQLEAVAQEAAALHQGTPGWGVRGRGGRQQALEAVLQQAQTLLESPSPTVGIAEQLTEWIAGLRQGAWGPRGRGLQLGSQGQGFRGPQVGLSASWIWVCLSEEPWRRDISSRADAPSPHRRALAQLAQMLWAPGQVEAESESWARGQCERLEELSRELDSLKGLAWPKRAIGVQDAEAQASSAALLSQEATLRAQTVASLGGPDSVLGQAREARRCTELLLKGTGQPTGTALWKLKLKGLVDRVQMLHPQLLRLLVQAGVECRRQGRGLACVPVPCVVPPCPGPLPTAPWALVVSRNASYSLDTAIAALEEQQQLLQQIQATAGSTGIQAREMWHRARRPWGVASTAAVQATVHRIQRFLLEEGADTMSVELVVWRGLAVPLPQGRAAGIALLLDQIQHALPSLDTAGQELPKARGVLRQAQQTREGAARAQDRALDVQGVLAGAGADARAAEQGLQVARQTLRGLEAGVQEMAGHLARITMAVDVTPALELLSDAAVALRTHLALSQRQAHEAEERSARAMGLAEGLGKELQVARLGVAELQEGTNSLMATVKDAGERVRRTRAEAQELLRQVQSSWSRLEGLERRLVQNEQTLGEKAATLWALEKRAAELLEHLQLWASAYATC